MNLYRAIYQAPAKVGGKLRGMTFAARDAETACKVAIDWQIHDRLLVVKPLRPLQRAPMQLTLEG
jgi:hypothetical protein